MQKHILTDSEEKCAAILESIVNGEKTLKKRQRIFHLPIRCTGR